VGISLSFLNQLHHIHNSKRNNIILHQEHQLEKK